VDRSAGGIDTRQQYDEFVKRFLQRERATARLSDL
jgi:hypothetical protein